MASIGEYNFTVTAGDTWSGMTVQMTVNEVALDLTDAVITMQARQTVDSAPVLSLTTVDSGGITITDALGGEFVVDPVVVSAPAGAYLYDINIVLGDDTIKTYLAGCMTVRAEYTHG